MSVLSKGKGKALAKPSPLVATQLPAPPMVSSSLLIQLSTSINQFVTLAEPTANQASVNLPVSGSSAAPSVTELQSGMEATLALPPYVAVPQAMLPTSGSAGNGEMPIHIDLAIDQSGPSGQDIEMREQ
jgi:hypothetical protein